MKSLFSLPWAFWATVACWCIALCVALWSWVPKLRSLPPRGALYAAGVVATVPFAAGVLAAICWYKGDFSLNFALQGFAAGSLPIGMLGTQALRARRARPLAPNAASPEVAHE